MAGEGHAEQADSSVPKRRWQKEMQGFRKLLGFRSEVGLWG